MIQVFHCKVNRGGQLRADVVAMHERIAFRVDHQALNEIFCEEAKWRELGLSFELVAEVEGEDLDRAFSATNHIDSDWSTNRDVKVMTRNPRRSTSVGDLVVRDGVTYVVDKFGFSKIARPEPIEDIAAEAVVEQETGVAPRG
ncbi:hypothetical protein LJR290_007470 [Variovorax sp. LjRoot290]|uniref:hypothetical protein n=1 Tax=Variovorax sp. LjRoot290 TaxID=3342316 RepID=UPI003ECE5E46